MDKPPIKYTQEGKIAMHCFIKYIQERIVEISNGETDLLVKLDEIAFDILAYIDGKIPNEDPRFINLVAHCDGSGISGALHDELTECMMPVLWKDPDFKAQMMISLREKRLQRKREQGLL